MREPARARRPRRQGAVYDLAGRDDDRAAGGGDDGGHTLSGAVLYRQKRYLACLEEARKRLSQGIRVFRLFPDRHGHPIDFVPAAELLEELAGQVIIVGDWPMGSPTALARLLGNGGGRAILESELADLLGEALAAVRRCLAGADDAGHRGGRRVGSSRCRRRCGATGVRLGLATL